MTIYPKYACSYQNDWSNTSDYISVLGPNHIPQGNMIGNMLLKLRRVTAEKSYLVWGVGVFNFQIVAKRMISVVAIPTQ